MNAARIFASALMVILFVSCQKTEESKIPNSAPVEESEKQIPFDRKAWMITDGTDYPHRESMIADLFKDDKLKGMTREQLVEKLGPPTRTDKNYLFYRISQTRIQFFPLKTRTLVIRLSPDGLSEAVMIHGG